MRRVINKRWKQVPEPSYNVNADGDVTIDEGSTHLKLSSTRASDIMKHITFDYRKNSPLLNQWHDAFMSSLDEAMEAAQNLYYGNMIAFASGARLDFIGYLLKQSRLVDLGKTFFGFEGAPGAIGGMADEATPFVGGVFDTGETSASKQLQDHEYRRLLLAKAYTLNLKTVNHEAMYHGVMTLLGKVPRDLKITESARSVSIEMSALDVPNSDFLLCFYGIQKYYRSTGTKITMTRV